MNTDKVMNSSFIKKWKHDMKETLKRINPDFTSSQIEETLDDMIKEQMQNPDAVMDNNYIGETRPTKLLSVVDWIEDREIPPIIAGNGTFYKTQQEAINPVATMLDDFLLTRKSIKKVMFTKPETSDEYKDLDRAQANEKINANSYYGASGTPISAFYSLWSGPATTISAQSAISTSQTAFEAFLSDNFSFIDINECFQWMNTILSEDIEMDEFVERVTFEDTLYRVKSLFSEYDDSWDGMLIRYLSGLTEDERTRIFYKNQLHEFTLKHTKIQKLIRKIFRNVIIIPNTDNINDVPQEFMSRMDPLKSYNEWVNMQNFMNPSAIPDTIKKELKELSGYYMKYILTLHLQFDRMYRLKNMKRKAVVLVDTDSNMLNCDPWIQLCFNQLLDSDYDKTEMQNTFIAVNIITSILTDMISVVLEHNEKEANVPKEFRKRITMKNEYFFTKLIIAKKKKRYLSRMKLREGYLYDPEKTDIKGFDFAKSQTSEFAEKFYRRLVDKRLLEPKDIDVKGLLKDLQDFENEIFESLKSGDKKYLQNMSCKALNAYNKKSPYSQQSVRAVYAWNSIYPNNTIELPAKVNVVKLKIFRVEDIDDLRRTHPEIHSSIIEKIFNNKEDAISSKGVQVLAIPSNAAQIPEWVIPYIDYTTLINNVIGQFASILEMLDIVHVPVGKTINGSSRKTNKFTNMIRF